MSRYKLFTFDADGNPMGVYDATDVAVVQRMFFLDLINLVGDETPGFEDVMPHLAAVPNDMVRPVVAVTFAQLLTIITHTYDFIEANGIESKAEMRTRWTELIEGLGDGDDE